MEKRTLTHNTQSTGAEKASHLASHFQRNLPNRVCFDGHVETYNLMLMKYQQLITNLWQKVIRTDK